MEYPQFGVNLDLFCLPDFSQHSECYSCFLYPCLDIDCTAHVWLMSNIYSWTCGTVLVAGRESMVDPPVKNRWISYRRRIAAAVRSVMGRQGKTSYVGLISSISPWAMCLCPDNKKFTSDYKNVKCRQVKQKVIGKIAIYLVFLDKI